MWRLCRGRVPSILVSLDPYYMATLLHCYMVTWFAERYVCLCLTNICILETFLCNIMQKNLRNALRTM